MNYCEEDLEREFLLSAANRSEFVRLNDSKRANREYDKLHKLKERMRQLPDRGKAALRRIAKASKDPEVQIAAAAALLAVDERFAIDILQQVQNGNSGLPSFTAEMTLREWRAGSMREYWG
jgi:hypothetical protein